MNIIKFLIFNWDSVLFVVVLGAGIVFFVAKKQYEILDNILFVLVTEAEKKYGGGTGMAKLAAVINWVYPEIPSVVRLFITADNLKLLIEHVLADARKRWNDNPSLLAYIEND